MRTNKDIKLGVSLYSYQEEYYHRKMDLEDCLAAVAGVGAEGVEIIPEQMIKGFPFPSDRFYNKWHEWMDQYDLTPVCADHFADRPMYRDRFFSDDEMIERTGYYLKTANRLGCKCIRFMSSIVTGRNDYYNLIDEKMTEKLLSLAEKYNVVLAMEVHAPNYLGSPLLDPYLEIIERTGTPYLRLHPDLGTFTRCIHKPCRDNFIRRGAKPEIVEYIYKVHKQYAAGDKSIEPDRVLKDISSMGGGEIEKELANLAFRYLVSTDIGKIKEYIKYIYYVHAKFNWAEEDGTIEEIDYESVLGALRDAGFKGYISSEFEGNRHMNDALDVEQINSVEQVRRQHLLMNRILNK